MGYSNIGVDNWAMGIMIYFLLSGIFPFRGKDPKDTLRKTFHGVYTFDYEPFYNVSFEAKDLISRLLTRNPQDRMTAYQAYHHPWIQNATLNIIHKAQLSEDTILRLSQFQFNEE